MPRDHRRLAAIVSLDVVGNSRRMGVASAKAFCWNSRAVVDAVRYAVKVQPGMAEPNVDVAPDKRLDFRIGISVGDIIIDGDDIFGDGVNVAARLEALASDAMCHAAVANCTRAGGCRSGARRRAWRLNRVPRFLKGRPQYRRWSGNRPWS